MNYELVKPFMGLFRGLDVAFGTGRGEWIKRPPEPKDFLRHINGEGPGIGIAPLMPDNHVWFAAIDLDEPDFEAAFEMQNYIPGPSYVERSRSGNAHVWVFFAEPCPAWLAMGVLREATVTADKQGVEVFPKNHDFARVKLGNYINLPYHGDSRPILWPQPDTQGNPPPPITLPEFFQVVVKNSPADWEIRARLLQVYEPAERIDRSVFGTQKSLHVCAERVIAGEAGTIVEGTRNQVFFMLAKCLLNCELFDYDDAWDIIQGVNRDLCVPMESPRELRRILDNVVANRYTSTGCDDVLVLPYTDPSCPIAHPNTIGKQ